MTAQAGKDVLLKIGDGGSPESFTSIAGLRAKTLSLNARAVEVTHADSPGRWRELLDGAGVRTAAISGAGIFVDSAADEYSGRHDGEASYSLSLASAGALTFSAL